MNLLFPELPSPKMHPANIGHDLVREEGFTPRLRELYLARALHLTMFDSDFKNVMANLRTVFNTGAKIVYHASAPKKAGDWDTQRLVFMKFYIDLAHSVDPELIFDAYLTDRISQTVAYIPIPASIFEAFSLPIENRCFEPSRMCYDETERKLWYYFRATAFIDAGFESISLAPEIPKQIAAMLENRIPLVLTAEIEAANPKREAQEDIKNRWIAEKQREYP